MKQFEQETGRELLVAKPKPTLPIPEIFPDSLLPSSSNAAKFDVLDISSEEFMNNTRVTSGKYQQGQTLIGTKQQRQSRRHRSDEPSNNILLIVLCVIAIGLLIGLVVILSKESSPSSTQKPGSSINSTRQDYKDSDNNHAHPIEKQEED